jgi:hypothetical protein
MPVRYEQQEFLRGAVKVKSIVFNQTGSHIYIRIGLVGPWVGIGVICRHGQ